MWEADVERVWWCAMSYTLPLGGTLSTREEPVVFGSAVEALRNGLQARFSAPLLEELRTLGLDMSRILPAYHMDLWCDALRILGRHLEGDAPEAVRYVRLGGSFMQGYTSTPIGTAALTMCRLIGPRRTLLRMGRNFKQATNYIESETKETGPKELLLRTYTHERFLDRTRDRSLLVPEYRRGVIEEILKLIRAEAVVEFVESHPEKQDVTFRVRWS